MTRASTNPHKNWPSAREATRVAVARALRSTAASAGLSFTRNTGTHSLKLCLGAGASRVCFIRLQGHDLTSRFGRIVTVWVLLLATAWVAEPYVVSMWASAVGPRTVTPRGDLSQAEQATIKLFQRVSPSVVRVFAQGSEQGNFLGEQQASFNPDLELCGMRRDT
jgi:hypothetical protein